ncbi:MAG: hypothetical protein ACR2HG_08070 [Pyrinomonadaceae bacterium]
MAFHIPLSAFACRDVVSLHVHVRQIFRDNLIMKLSLKKISICVVIAISCAAIYQIYRIYHSAQTALAEDRARLSERNSVAFRRVTLAPHPSNSIRILQNTTDIRSIVRFQDSYYAATGGGLIRLSDDGKITKHFTVLDGLPESDLTALAVFDRKLFIGTRTRGLLEFDGERFVNYIWTDRKAQAVTAFLIDGERLLIGTFNGGLIEFDGGNFREIKVDNSRISAVNCLAKNGTRIYVGTFASGLWIYENAVWSHFTTNEGLPSNRVVGIAPTDKNTFVATDFGLSVLQENNLLTLQNLTAVSSIVEFGNRVFLSRDDSEIFTFDKSLNPIRKEKDLTDARLVQANEKLFLLGNQGVFALDGKRFKSFSQSENDAPTDNFVSALTVDNRGNLWAGLFRRGVDVFAEDGKKINHIETETIREINFLRAEDKKISAATAQGLFDFKPDFSVNSLTKENGLPSNSVAHFSGDVLATARGLVFMQNGKPQILSATNGLPSNSIYTTLQIGRTLYAGTLGGLAQIENRRVVRVWKDSNSNLTTNWVTSLISANDRIFIGTYGGGIFELTPSGEIRVFAGETGKFTVNPNAMTSDGERLYAGTLEGAKVLDLRTQEWKTVKDILPAETVLSIAVGSAGEIYFGTTNGIARVEKNYFTSEEWK